MKEKKQQNIEYIIEYAGLPIGEHSFVFIIDNNFMQQYRNEPLENDYNLNVKISLIKQHHNVKAKVHIEGTASVICDKCLISYLYPIHSEKVLLIEKGNPENSTDEIIMVEENNNKVNFSQYLYETISLSIPYKIVPCEISENVQCNEKVLSKITENLSEKNKITTFAELFKSIKNK